MDNVSQFVSRHWQLAVAFAVILLVLMIYEYFSLKKAGKAISTAQAIEQINHFSAVVIDLRPAEIYKKGHIIGAIRGTETDFRLPKMHQHKDKPVILVCSRGLEAQKLAPKLSAQGFSQLMTLEGGIAAWQAANLPLVKK
ncbi:MAG: rhodanese-like domain-containing protein [Legionellales bacterium]|nr:rhodanese-like domain-containing protein [Legionellales bacterium]